MKGKYACPKCKNNDWKPRTWGDIPSDECAICGYIFTQYDIPKEEGKAE